jgi:hypothetical protein
LYDLVVWAHLFRDLVAHPLLEAVVLGELWEAGANLVDDGRHAGYAEAGAQAVFHFAGWRSDDGGDFFSNFVGEFRLHEALLTAQFVQYYTAQNVLSTHDGWLRGCAAWADGDLPGVREANVGRGRGFSFSRWLPDKRSTPQAPLLLR